MANRPHEEEGGSGGRELFLDTQGACFLCLQDPSSSGGDEGGSANGGNGLRGVSLRDICRYLGIRGLGKSGLKGRGGGSTEFFVDLCGKCGVHVNQLSESIRVLEEAERGIAKELQEVQVILKGCLEREECKLQWVKIGKNNPIDIRIIDYLREETGKKGSEKLKILTATKTTQLNLSTVDISSNLNASRTETGTTDAASNPNLTPMSATPSTAPPPTSSSTREVPVSPARDADASIRIPNGSSPETATRTSRIFKTPTSRLIGSATRVSSNLNQMNGVTPSGSRKSAPENGRTSTVSNPSATVAPPATTSTTPMSSPSDLDSSNETPPLTSTPKKRRWYRGEVKTIFSKSYKSKEVNGVQKFCCLICKKTFDKNSATIRKHIMCKHPEILFTNVCNLPHLQFKSCIKKSMSTGLEDMVLKNDDGSYQCKICKDSFRVVTATATKAKYKYHLVMKHYPTLEKKMRRLQEAVASKMDDAGESSDVEGTSSMSPSNDLESSNASSSKRTGRRYKGSTDILISRSYVSKKENGVQQFHCRHCTKIVKMYSSNIRRHVLCHHPEALFTNVNNLSHLEFKNYVEELLLTELENVTEKNKRWLCKVCQVSFRDESEYKYHLVMKHHSKLEKKLKRLQEAAASETDEGRESDAVGGGREEQSLSEGRASRRASMRARFECLVWSGGCGKIFSTVENLRMHEKVCEGKGIGGTLEGARGKRKMHSLNDGGSACKIVALIKSKKYVEDNGSRQGGIWRSARQEISVRPVGGAICAGGEISSNREAHGKELELFKGRVDRAPNKVMRLAIKETEDTSVERNQ